MPSTDPKTPTKHRLWQLGAYMVPFVYAAILLIWPHLLTSWLVIVVGLFVVSLFIVAGVLHIRDLGGFRRSFHDHPVIYILLIVSGACTLLGSVMYRVMRHANMYEQASGTKPQARQLNTSSPPEKPRVEPKTSKPTRRSASSAKASLPHKNDEPLPQSSGKTTLSPQQSSIPNGNIQIGSGNNSQTMVNSPGGMQAGGDIVAIGKLPVPPRALLPEDIAEARRILKTSKGSIAIISFPTNVPATSEIYRFTDALSYALSQENWRVWRARGYEYSVNTYSGRTDMPYGTHGVGCDSTEPDSEEAKTVVRALAALHLYCTGPAVNYEHGQDDRFTTYITVGTRITAEQ